MLSKLTLAAVCSVLMGAAGAVATPATTSKPAIVLVHGAFADAGGLMSYGADGPTMFRHCARFVQRILQGRQPNDLPIEQPTKFELVINLKTAKALGLDVPLRLQQLADQVIE